MTKFVLLYFITQCYLHMSSSTVYFTMTNVHMNLPLDANSVNLGISLGKIYATSDSLTTSNRTNVKSPEEDFLFSVVNTSAFIDISEYNGKVYLLKEVFKEKMKDQNHTVAFSARVGSSVSITPFTLSLSKANNPQQYQQQHKAADKGRNALSTGSLRLPADCNKVVNDLCFWPSVTYRVFENENGTVLGSLSPTYFHEECKNYTVKYKMKDSSNFTLLPPEDGESAWRLAVHAPLNRDATHSEHYQFNHKQRARLSGDIVDLPVTCWVETGKPGSSNKGGKRYNVTRRLEIRVLDRNDNAPMAQYSDIKIFLDDNRVKEGQELHHDKLLFIDRDSQEVNTYDIRILNDTAELLVPQCTPYAVPHHVSNHTVLHCKLVFRKSTQMPTSPYTIIIQIIDTSLLNGLNASHVQLPIQIISDSNADQVKLSSKALVMYSQQFVEIYRSAAPFARLTQPKSIPFGFGQFRIMDTSSNTKNLVDDGVSHTGCFNVTPNSGIVFVHDVALLRISSNMRLNIQWINASNMVDYDELTIHVINEPTPTCTNISADTNLSIFEMIDNWNFCSNSESYRECERSCGLSTGGYVSMDNIKKRHGPPRCQWRGEKSPGDESTTHYATCTPDLNTCPDGVCDELEDLHHLICPQDCTRSRVISTIPNDSKRGIKIAAGICKCDDFDNCYCNIMDKRKKNSVKSDSRTIGNHSESSRDAVLLSYNSLNRHTDHQPSTICGTSCIIGLTAATIFIVLALTGAVLCWKLGLGMAKVRRRRRSSKYSDDIPDLLSAQLSDYVDRNNGPSPAVLQSNAVDQQMLVNGQHLTMGVTFDMGNGVTGVMIRSRLIPPPDPKWEFPRSQLIIEQTLGEGEFGRVLKAKAKDITGHPGYTTVAVKTLKDDARDAELADLMSEYELLKGVCHPNVIRILGASTVPGGPIYIIMEFAEFGSLRSYIRRTRHLKSESHIPASDGLNAPNLEHYDQPKPQPQQEILTSKDILSFAWQISKGMAYLTDIKLVHRDLAARNVLVASGKICKISDFGLTRDVYEDDAYFKRSKGRVPVKWMAPESLSEHIYTTKSDIWSFGVLIWELVTLGATPYPGIPVQNLFHVLKNGYRMERPENCSAAIYRIMRKCWESDPEQRPSFMGLSLQWETMLEQDIEYLDLTPDAIHNRSYFCTLLSEDNNELESTTILNPAFSSNNQPGSQTQTDLNKILNNEEQLNLDKNQHSNIKHGESSKLFTTSSSIEDKSNNNNNNTTNKKSNTYSNTPNANLNSSISQQHPNNIMTEERDALMADSHNIGEGYESPIKVRQKSPGNRTPTNEHPQYYTDMTVGNNGSGGSKQLLLPCGNGNSIADLINTN